MPCRRPALLASLAFTCLLLATPRLAAAGCDPTFANTEALAEARAAIDAACPCAAATSPSEHAKCAKVVVNARVENGDLVRACKSAALNHAKKSICGRPGAVVCCRVKPGKTSHKIAKTPEKCVSTSTFTACTSVIEFVDTGCDANGCVAPLCGNEVVEPTETCEPPDDPDCDDTCQIEECDPPVTSCGNGTLDAGEACEPPGTGACSWDCQAMTCSAPGPGEVGVACVTGTATVGVGSRGSDYLLTWSGNVHRAAADVIAQRFDTNGVPLETSARVVSTGAHCGSDAYGPVVGGNAGRYALAWQAFTPEFSSAYHRSIYTRSYENDGSLGVLAEPQTILAGFGMCQATLGGPTAITPVPIVGPHAFAALWNSGFVCVIGSGFFLRGQVIDHATGEPIATDVLTFGYSQPGPTLSHVTTSPAGIASLGGDTLLAWHVVDQTSNDVAGAWLAADGTPSNFILSSRAPGIGGSGSSGGMPPTVAAATDRFLVAWAQGPTNDAFEIRGMRVTHAGGPLDPDGGLALATTAGGKVVGRPVAAFDGTVWLVAWTEVGVGGNDLRAVAVQTDGTVVDATPRLLATGLGNAAPSIASAGNGKALVMYVKPDGASHAVRAQLVPGT